MSSSSLYVSDVCIDEKLPFLEHIEQTSLRGLECRSSIGCRLNGETIESATIWTSDFCHLSPVVKSEVSGTSFLGSWNLYVPNELALGPDKQISSDVDLGMVMLNPRTMAPVKVEDDIVEQPLDVKHIPSPEMERSVFDGDRVITPIVIQPEEPDMSPPAEMNLVLEEKPWNREVVLIQIAPTSNTNGGALKVRNVDSSKSLVAPTKPAIVREERYEKPPFSYSCLIALALKNSDSGFLPVSEIYSYILDNFPFFRTAPDGWKNSIRHNLSLNKCFQKLETPSLNGTTRKACLWGLNEDKIARLDEDILKWMRRTPDSKHVLSGYKTERHEKEVVTSELSSARQPDEAKLPAVVTSVSKSPSWFGSITEQSDVKLFKIVKVTSENNPCSVVPDVIKQEKEDILEPQPHSIPPHLPKPDFALEDCHDPMVGGLTIQNGLWDDLTETGELLEAAESFVSKTTQPSQQSVCRLSNESPMTLKTIIAFA